MVVWYGLDIGYKMDRQKVTSLDRWFEGIFGMQVDKKKGYGNFCDSGMLANLENEMC